MSWADIKAEARQTVHETFKRAAVYVGPETLAGAEDCFVRWHAAGARLGHLTGGSDGYAEIVTSRDRIVFDTTTIEFTPAQGGTITLADEPMLTLRLDVQEETDGPVTDAWLVTRE